MTASSYRCRTCGNAVVESDPHFPFCSERCRLVDLGGWLSERYRISRPARPGGAGDPLTGGESAEDASTEEGHED
ncbi:MAG: DNA gyrase inhibitor YacG [Planctomycetota bacterium]